jgi:hypothetical protein
VLLADGGRRCRAGGGDARGDDGVTVGDGADGGGEVIGWDVLEQEPAVPGAEEGALLCARNARTLLELARISQPPVAADRP